ncbi:hypothetical protein SALBM135S_00580 [Streptomyces alboniger]
MRRTPLPTPLPTPLTKTTKRSLTCAAAAALGCAGLVALPANAAAAAGDLTVQYHAGATGGDQAEPWLKVKNTGDSGVALSAVKIRYYFKADAGNPSYRFACSWAVKGCANITGRFGTLAEPTATADRYLEIGFTSGAGSLPAGADTGDLQLRFHRADWQRLNQSDDYSFGATQSAYANWSKVTAQLDGAVVWGTAPEGNDPTDPTDPTDPPGDGATLFDDFTYTAYNDPRIAANGWSVRSNSGGPGVPGATWAPQNVTFASSGGNTVMNLETSTAGTGESTKQTEVLTKSMKFKNGTYAARVRFNDTPRGGPDGDHLVQTFFTINDLKAPMADDYAEYDFEYLPNGGWGEPANILYTTSWETYAPDPWQAVNQHTEKPAQLCGLARPGGDHRQRLHPLLRGRAAVRHARRRLSARAPDVDQLQPVADRPGGPVEHHAALVRPAGGLRPARQGPGPHPGAGGRQGRRLPVGGHRVRGHGALAVTAGGEPARPTRAGSPSCAPSPSGRHRERAAAAVVILPRTRTDLIPHPRLSVTLCVQAVARSDGSGTPNPLRQPARSAAAPYKYRRVA